MNIAKYRKPPSLSAQIRIAERRVSERQKQVRVYRTALSQNILRQLAAPPNLLLASGIGFILGELTKSTVKRSANRQLTKTTPLKKALHLFSSLHTIYTALPLVWLLNLGTVNKVRGRTPASGHYSP